MNHRVLVLNLDYSPISICSVQRAFLLLYLEKAQMMNEVGDMFLHTVNKSFPLPAVIKLNRFVNIPYKSVELTRQNVFKRDGFECKYCGTDNNLTLDHVIPRSKGGKSTWSNLITACKSCNAKKGDYTPHDAGLVLNSSPYKPSYVMFIRDFSGFVMNEWIPFLRMQSAVKSA